MGANEIGKHSACEIFGGLKVSQNIILISIDRKTRLEIIMYEEMACMCGNLGMSLVELPSHSCSEIGQLIRDS